MDGLLILTILIVIFALAFDFINGFHDTANAIATAVSTKALKPRHAIIISCCYELCWCNDLYRCCKNHYRRYCRSFYITKWFTRHFSCSHCRYLWNLITWYFGIPSSSSHAIIGSIAGAAIAAAGFSSLNYSGFINILKALILSPIIAFVVGYIVYSIFKVVI